VRDVIDLAPGLSRGLATGPLLEDTGAAVATRLGAEAATLAHGFAGAVLLAALAVRPEGRPVACLAAHDIEIAGPLRDFLTLAGARPVAIGSVDRASLQDVEQALTAETAAALWVALDRNAGPHLLALPPFRHAARCRGIPTIVLAPEGQNVEGLLDAGADLLVLDATTALAGPPLGIVAGRPDLVASARAAQSAGPGRLTLPAPDHLAALVAGFVTGHEARLHERRARLAQRLAGRPGLRLLPTATGVALHLDPPTAGTTARDLAHALAIGQPVLLTDDRAGDAGQLGLDLARLDDAAFETVLATLARTLEQPIPPAAWP
jgi:seryl-tRNA(Sec) selenium transferase